MENNLFILKEVILKNGQKLILRRVIEDDAEMMIKYLNTIGGESDNLLFGENEFHFSVEQEREYINKSNNNNDLIIIGLIDNNIVSVANIGKLTRKRIAHNSEVAISVKREYWGIGVGYAVMSELIEFAKNNNIKNISLGVKASNNKAFNLYKKFGFEEVGRHKNFFNVNDVFDDEILMDLSLN